MPTTATHENHHSNANDDDDAHSTLLTNERTPLLLRPPSTTFPVSTSSSPTSSSSKLSASSGPSSSKRNYSIKISSPSSSTSSPSSRRRSARSPTSPSPTSSPASSSPSPSTSSPSPSTSSSSSSSSTSPSTSTPSPTSSSLRSPTSSSLRSPPPLQWSQIYIILLLQLCEPLTSQSIYPYINDLVRGLPVTRGDEHNVGFYAGLVESLFFLTEALTVLHWSRISDRVGRKPVLLVGLLGLGASTLGFGLASTFVGIVVSRCICGMLNGNIGVMKSVMGELTTPANRAQGFALMPVVWSAGATLGPLIGGGLSKPYDRFPPASHLPFPLSLLSVFHTQFWKDHPYFLPCAAVALLVGAAWVVTALFFRETLNRRPPSTSSPSSAPNRQRGRTPLRSLLTRRTLVPIANYALLALLSISINALQPLFLSTPSTIPSSPSSPSSFTPSSFPPPSSNLLTPSNTQTSHLEHGSRPKLGIPGLALPPPTIGLILGAFGVLNGLFQALFFPAIVSKFGAKGVFRVGVGAAGAVGAGFAGMGWVGGYYIDDANLLGKGVGGMGGGLGGGMGGMWGMGMGGGGGGGFGWMVWALVGVQLALCVLVDMAYGCIFMFITASAPAHALGATNGLAQTAVSVARAIGPVAASSLFSVSLGWRYKYEYEYEHQQRSTTSMSYAMSYGGSGWVDWMWGLLGANMVYIFVVALSGVAVWVGGMLPDTLDESPDESDGEDSACGEGERGERGKDEEE